MIYLQFWAYGSRDSLFPISMSPTANLWVQKTIFNDKSAILLHPGTRWNKNFASQRQNYGQDAGCLKPTPLDYVQWTIPSLLYPTRRKHWHSSHYTVMHVLNKNSNIQGRSPNLAKVFFPCHKELLWEQFLSFKKFPLWTGTQINWITAWSSSLPLLCVTFSVFWCKSDQSLS